MLGESVGLALGSTDIREGILLVRVQGQSASYQRKQGKGWCGGNYSGWRSAKRLNDALGCQGRRRPLP